MSHEIETMAAFFDRRAEAYEDHMRGILDVEGFYGAVAGGLPQSEESLCVLDLGCGTGLELHYLFGRMPHAQVTGIDLSGVMLDRLRETYRDRMGQIALVQDNYAGHPLGEACYDCAVSVQSLHHFLPEAKLTIYRRIASALRPGGAYLEGDFVVDEPEAAVYLKDYHEARAEGDDALYHLDIPLTVEKQMELLWAAGFGGIDVLYHAGTAAVFRAVKG